LDPSGIAPTFPSTLQEDQGLCPARLVPPVEASLLCRSPCIRSRLRFFSKNLRPSQTQRYVRIYNLAEQKLLKMLTPGIRWISSMDVHPSGDHLIVGGYDRKLCWFDLELSEKPYKILRYAKFVHYALLISHTHTHTHR
jgi:WD40 repeat protein